MEDGLKECFDDKTDDLGDEPNLGDEPDLGDEPGLEGASDLGDASGLGDASPVSKIGALFQPARHKRKGLRTGEWLSLLNRYGSRFLRKR